jgi:thiol-disulfide isomerase/thioredoxin
MTRNILILMCLLSALAAYTLYEERGAIWAHNISADAQSPERAEQAPDFQFTSLSGKSHRLSDFNGKAVVLNFWASWCAPCLIEFPQMLDLAKMTNDKAVFLFISVDEKKENMERFLKKMGKAVLQKNVFIAHDPRQVITQDLYQTYRLPETYLINSEGLIADKIIGASITWNDDAAKQRVEALVR